MRWMFGLVALDWLVKRLALAWIPPLVYGSYPYGGIPVFDWGGISFSLNFVVNTGAAWGLFAGHAGLLFAIRLAIIVGVIGWVKKSWPIWLILAGALGNGVDYCQYGHVIDFFHFNFWGYSFPIFNVADACISIGALSLFLFPKKVGQPQALYRNNLKNREYAKEAPRFLSKLAGAEAAKLEKFSDVGGTKSGGCPTPAETDSSGYFGI